jgi:Domain of unknown function (DUF4387)
MPEGTVALSELAEQVRSKNAGPFWITLDIFFADEARYRRVASSGVLSAETIGHLYRVDPGVVQCFELPGILALKISFPRSVTAGSFGDRDLHAGQQHVPLLGLQVPA